MSSKSYKTRSRTSILSANLIHTVNNVLSNFFETEPYLNFFIPTTENLIEVNDDDQKRMRSGEVVLSEGNSDLWERALVTSLGEINTSYFPHYHIVQNLINYTLNSSSIHFGMVTSFFTKLVLFHPPIGTNMQGYYWCVLNDRYVMLNNIKAEEKCLFWCLVESVTSCLENDECLKDVQDDYSVAPCDNNNTEKELLELMLNLNKRSAKDRSPLRQSLSKTQTSCFESLPPADKLRRMLVVFGFLCDVLEADLVHRMKANPLLTGKDGRTFLSVLLWQNVKDVGTMSAGARELIHMYKLMEVTELCLGHSIHKKLLTLLAEIVRRSDAALRPVYPFFGKNSHALACDIALKFIEALTETHREEARLPVQTLKPHWLRLLVCCNLLSHITGKLCSPELTHMHDILEYALHLMVQRQDGLFNLERRRSGRGLRKSWDLNESSKHGSEHCHNACRLKRGKRLKTSQTANSNDLNESGWSVLHEAVLRGHEGCVEDILHQRGRKKPDVRLKAVNGLTPLMCAVAKGRPKICRMLLEHSGPELLEDVTDNGCTATDLCPNAEVADVLRSFARRTSSSPVDGRFYFTSDDAKLVIGLCAHAAESYLITHRTRDVWERLKSGATAVRFRGAEWVRFDYFRYDSDAHVTVRKLATLVLKLTEYKEVKRCVEPLMRILSFDCGN